MEKSPFTKPVFLYDGECEFCCRWTEYFKRNVGERVSFRSFQTTQQDLQEIPLSELKKAVHFIELNGEVADGAEATFRMFTYSPSTSFWYWMYRHIPGFCFIAETVYRFVVRHR